MFVRRIFSMTRFIFQLRKLFMISLHTVDAIQWSIGVLDYQNKIGENL